MTTPPPPSLWDLNASYQRIGLKGLTVEMHIGIAEHEQGRKQRVVVHVDLFAHAETLAPSNIKDCLDYDRIHAYVTAEWPKRPHTDLLETLAEELVQFCLQDTGQPGYLWS